jgi:hypothetical protein
MARPRMHCALLLSLAAIASSQDVYLGEDLNVTMYDGRVAACSHPEVAENNTCTCAPGFTWTDNVCTSCALGSYKEEAGEHACTSCPEFHTTFPNATEAADCLCTHGYEPGVGAQACSPCNPGFYKAFKGGNACQACTANATSLAGSVDASACACLPGFEGTFDTGCIECPVDFYRAAGDAVCRPCPLNSGTPSSASIAPMACVCKPGFQPEASNCIACAAGSFKTALAMLACSACPGNSTSQPSSSAQEDCVCNAGFYHLPDAQSFVCAVCTAGSFCPGQRAIYPCATHSLSEPGATSPSDCVCESSMFKTDDICVGCPSDTYCPGDNNKYLCPNDSAAPEHSQALSDCTCDGGFEKL